MCAQYTQFATETFGCVPALQSLGMRFWLQFINFVTWFISQQVARSCLYFEKGSHCVFLACLFVEAGSH